MILQKCVTICWISSVFPPLCNFLFRWFKAEEHGPQLLDFMRGTRDLQRGFHCLDIFGASGRVKNTWEDAGFSAAGFDIRLSDSHDICGETGVKILLRMGLESLDVNLHTTFCSKPFEFAIKDVCQGFLGICVCV